LLSPYPTALQTTSLAYVYSEDREYIPSKKQGVGVYLGGGMLPGMHKALGSIPSTSKNKNQKVL
jgi:hypothetical protein